MRGFGKLAASIAALALITGPVMAQDQARVSSPGHYAGYAPKLYDEWVRSNIYVEARDGVRLAVTLYRPARNGVAVEAKHPVVFAFTPYRRLARNLDGTFEGLGEKEHGGQPGMAELTKYGYVVAVADVRGKGASFGVRGAYQDENEARDGYDLVEWLARQSFADGKVGMFGCSYYGGTQLATARLAPPHLKAVFPEAAPLDAYRMANKGGISGQFNTRYQSNAEDIGTVPVDADKDGTLAEQARKQHAANGQMLDIITQMPFRDDRNPATDVPYWRQVSFYQYLDTIRRSGIAVYFWGNWFDEVADQSLIGYSTLKDNPRKLMMGTGTHCGLDGVDTVAEHHRFFDRYLKGVDNGIDHEPPVYYRTINAPAGHEWQFSKSWPPAGTQEQRWFLDPRPSGSLTQTAFDGTMIQAGARPGKAPYTVDYDVGCIVPARFNPGVGKPKPGEETKPQPGYWPCVLDKIGATFTTAALSQDLTITGTPVAELKLSASRDANLFVYLETVAADGTVEIISHGRLKASARKISAPPYDNLGLPWHSNMKADALPVTPGETIDVAMELSPTAIRVPKGSRLRLTVTGADLRQRNLDAIKVSPPPHLDIATGMQGTVLRLPVNTAR